MNFLTKTLNKLSEIREKSLDQNDDAPINIYNSWDGKELEEFDIILVSSTFYAKFMTVLYRDSIKLKRVVFDEADSIKIQGSYMIENSFIWYVTSTFGTLLNPNGIRMWRNEQGVLSEHYSYDNGFIHRVYLNGISSKGFIKNPGFLSGA